MTDTEIDALVAAVYGKFALSKVTDEEIDRALFRAGMREAARILENGDPLDRPAASIIRAAAGEGEA